MIEALWTMEFGKGESWTNGGVLVFETGRALGGDSRFYVTGDYDAAEGRFTARLWARHYHGDCRTPFGDEATSYRMTLSGEREGETIYGTLARDGFAPLHARLTWRCDLPTGVA